MTNIDLYMEQNKDLAVKIAKDFVANVKPDASLNEYEAVFASFNHNLRSGLYIAYTKDAHSKDVEAVRAYRGACAVLDEDIAKATEILLDSIRETLLGRVSAFEKRQESTWSK